MSWLYKLTDKNGMSGLYYSNPLQWSEGVEHEITPSLRDKSQALCSSSYIHAYENPLVAVFMNPVHARFKQPILWKATGQVVKRDRKLKCGCFSLRVHEKLELPVISTTQRVKIAIYCSLVHETSEQYKNWATKWLSGEDRTKDSAAATADIAYDDYAADAAATAADAASAVYASAVATASAYAAASAAYAADLVKIIKRVMKEEPA